MTNIDVNELQESLDRMVSRKQIIDYDIGDAYSLNDQIYLDVYVNLPTPIEKVSFSLDLET